MFSGEKLNKLHKRQQILVTVPNAHVLNAMSSYHFFLHMFLKQIYYKSNEQGDDGVQI